MKALIRRKDETVTEDMGIPGIEWGTGYPLTAPGWAGGPYTLVNNYTPSVEDGITEDPEPAPAATPEASQNPDAPVPVRDIIVIDGVTYTRTS